MERTGKGLRRRDALGLLGGAGLSGLLAGCGGDDSASLAAPSCVLTPETTEGPYWIDTNLTRRAARASAGSRWWSYSPFRTPGPAGRSREPTWRSAHLKVHAGGDVVHTGQVFSGDGVAAAVYSRAPYRSHGQPDVINSQDGIYAEAGGSRARLKLRRREGGKRGYRGTITLGVVT